MAIKASVAVLSSSWIPVPTLTSSVYGSHHLSPRIRSPSPLSATLKRRYATGRDTHDAKWAESRSSSSDDIHIHAFSWPKTRHPTPYDVLGIPKDAAYDKRRFYQLVKFYHPDTHEHHHHHLSSSSEKLSSATRLERYRLVVAANDLLSDSSKRRLYDIHGIGWPHDGRSPSLRGLDRSWRNQPGSAANNATWEDWKRWHEARQGKPSEPVYMSHGMFASIIVLACLVGAMAQTNRVGTASTQNVEWTSMQNAFVGEQLRRNGMAAANRSKDERVDCFLRERENVNYQFVPSKYNATEKHRPP